MYQQEIKFFWPLTEQIPLDLDYTGCQKPAVSISGSVGTGITTISTQWTTSNSVKSDEIDTKKLSIVLDKKPNFVVRWLYKILHINWKI